MSEDSLNDDGVYDNIFFEIEALNKRTDILAIGISELLSSLRMMNANMKTQTIILREVIRAMSTNDPISK